MARSRNIKPGFFTNEQLADCGPLGRLLFAGLWCHSDREGRCKDAPRALKIKILPYDRCDPEQLLAKLAEQKFILRYEVNGAKYIQVLTFKEHQNPHHREPPSKIPPPPDHLLAQVRAQGQTRAGPADSGFLIPDSPPPPTPSAPPPGRKSRPQKPEEGEEVCSLDGDWIGLEKPLRACGVVESTTALAAARKAQCTPAEVGMLIAHFEAHPKAWTPNLLYARIKSLRPGDDPSKGWPPPSHEHRQHVEAQRKPAALGPTREQLIEENKARLAALEQRYGAAADALTDEEFLSRVKPALVPRLREKGRQDALVRESVMVQLEVEGNL